LTNPRTAKLERTTMLETKPRNSDAPHATVEQRLPDRFPARLLALGLCACAGSTALLALLIVMVT
jgi:hypothetical protein